MRTNRTVSFLTLATFLNTFAVLMLLAITLLDHRHTPKHQNFSETVALYSSMDATELSTRFARPDLFADRDEFARANALTEILNRRLLKRGLHVETVRRLLGDPDSSITPEGTEGIRIGEPFEWNYDNLPASGLRIWFSADERVTRIRWIWDDGPDGKSRSRDYL